MDAFKWGGLATHTGAWPNSRFAELAHLSSHGRPSRSAALRFSASRESLRATAWSRCACIPGDEMHYVGSRQMGEHEQRRRHCQRLSAAREPLGSHPKLLCAPRHLLEACFEVSDARLAALRLVLGLLQAAAQVDVVLAVQGLRRRGRRARRVGTDARGGSRGSAFRHVTRPSPCSTASGPGTPVALAPQPTCRASSCDRSDSTSLSRVSMPSICDSMLALEDSSSRMLADRSAGGRSQREANAWGKRRHPLRLAGRRTPPAAVLRSRTARTRTRHRAS